MHHGSHDASVHSRVESHREGLLNHQVLSLTAKSPREVSSLMTLRKFEFVVRDAMTHVKADMLRSLVGGQLNSNFINPEQYSGSMLSSNVELEG